jgi:hypothetical protein
MSQFSDRLGNLAAPVGVSAVVGSETAASTKVLNRQNPSSGIRGPRELLLFFIVPEKRDASGKFRDENRGRISTVGAASIPSRE